MNPDNIISPERRKILKSLTVIRAEIMISVKRHLRRKTAEDSYSSGTLQSKCNQRVIDYISLYFTVLPT